MANHRATRRSRLTFSVLCSLLGAVFGVAAAVHSPLLALAAGLAVGAVWSRAWRADKRTLEIRRATRIRIGADR